jgi:gamma-glutamylputrescine oxidase
MTVSYWQHSLNSEQIIECDVCIIGAGITGSSIAWWLHKLEPGMKLAIIDSRSSGSGASGRNAGMVLAGLADHYDLMVDTYGRDNAREIWQATLDHRRLLGEFLRESRKSVELEECGSWRLGYEPSEREHLERSATLLQEDGFNAQFYSKDPLNRGFYGALGIDGDAGLHSLMLVNSLIESSGANLYPNCEAFGFNYGLEHIEVLTSGGTFRSKLVIIALNAYAPLLHDYFKLFISPHRGQIFVTAPLQSRILDRLVYTHHGYIYFRQLPDNRVLIGGWRHEFAEYEAGYMDEVTKDVQGALERFLIERFPETAGVPIETRWAGTMGFSKDGLPIVGTLPEDKRVAYAVGFTGHGFGLALEVSRRVVRMLLNGEHPGIFATRP